eukprot:5618389-Prymnesium_polylepis.1
MSAVHVRLYDDTSHDCSIVLCGIGFCPVFARFRVAATPSERLPHRRAPGPGGPGAHVPCTCHDGDLSVVDS